MAGGRAVFGITLALLCTGCWPNLIVERKGGLTLDKFTLSSDSCTKESSCGDYGADNQGENFDCRCICTELNSTFSVSRKYCIKNVQECENYTVGDDGRLFTFSIIDETLYPSLPVRELVTTETDLWSCNTQALTTEFEDDNGWFKLPSSVFTIYVKAPSNSTYLQIEKGNYSVVDGRLVKVSYKCTNPELDKKEVCVAFKIQGVTQVSFEELEGSTVSQHRTSAIDINLVYWITGGCIGALLMGAIVSLSIVCLWKKRNYEESIKVDRLKGSAYSKKNIATQLTRSSNFENGARYLGPNQARKHIYRKNQPVHNGGSPRRFPESPRRSRTPHSQAQHSAMFVVNEGEQRTLHPLPTEQKGTKKPILKRSAKEEQERSKSLKIARTALVQFEGERLHAVGSSSHRDELFDANNQRMSNINASLRGMGKRFVHSDPNINNPNQTSSKKGKKKEKMKELPGSIWSIDYEHFEMPVGADPKLEEESQPSQTPRSVGHRSETSIEDNEQTLREYDIDPAALKPVDEFAEELPITNIDELNNFFDQKPQTESILDESLKCFDSESSSDSDTMSSLSLVKTRSPEELLEENSELSDIEDIKYGLTTGSCEKRRDSVESYDYAVVKRDWSGKMSEFTPPDQDLNIPVSNIDDYADPPELPPHPDKASTLPLDAYEEVQQQYRTLDSISVGTLKQQQGADSYWYGDTPL